MSDKVIRHYSRPYGDCRADKRLYFGGSWPWQQGADHNIYVCGSSSNKIWKITTAGVKTEFVP